VRLAIDLGSAWRWSAASAAGARAARCALQATQLSGDIVNFLRQRAVSAPRHPAPATWDRDVAAVLQYEAEDVELFDRMFGPQVRRTRQLFDLEGLTERDLDAFYRHPANAFQMNIIAQKLAALARRDSGGLRAT
jgi:hypothetical protein